VLEELAKDDGYDYIFDRSGEVLLLFASDKHDLTEKVIARMKSFGK
jgi:Skp family chaperone for outer membrane proteins